MPWKRSVTKSQEYSEIIMKTIREPLVLDPDLRVVSVDCAFMSSALWHSNQRRLGSPVGREHYEDR
jgi:hypothetical protein